MKSSEMWCCRRMKKTSLTDRVKKIESITQSHGGEKYPTFIHQ
jgi:hypothetical protein